MQAPSAVVMERAETLQELWNGFNAHRVAFLDLQKMEVAVSCGLTAVGRSACLAGDLHLVPGQFGASLAGKLPPMPRRHAVSCPQPPPLVDIRRHKCACAGEERMSVCENVNRE